MIEFEGSIGEIKNIKILNNTPNIVEFELLGCPLQEGGNYSCYKESRILISCSVEDKENNGITCNISANDSQSLSASCHNYTLSIPYQATTSGTIMFNLSARDKDRNEVYQIKKFYS